jgi:hypothetical protein
LGGTATTVAGLTSVTSTTFVGALTGNASTATSATTATNATNIAITDNTSSSSTYYPVLSGATTGNNAATTSSTKLSFVPNTGTLTASLISGTRINPRVSSASSVSTLTVNSDSYDQAVLTAQAASLSVAAPTGTPVNGQKLTIRIKDNGTAQTISWTITSGGFRVIGCTLPTTTVINKVIYVGCIYNSDDSFWDVVSVAQQI